MILHHEYSTMILKATTMEHNWAGVGGAVALDHFAKLFLSQGSVSHNRLHDDNNDNNDGGAAIGQGGGIYAAGHASVVLTDGVALHGNKAVVRGGGVFVNHHASFRSTGGVSFQKNTAGESGGAVYLTHIECDVVEDEVDNSTLMSWSPPCIDVGAGCYAAVSRFVCWFVCVFVLCVFVFFCPMYRPRD